MIDPRTAGTRRTRRWSRVLVTGAVTASIGLTAVAGVASGVTATSVGSTASSGSAQGTRGTATTLGSGSSSTSHATSSGS